MLIPRYFSVARWLKLFFIIFGLAWGINGYTSTLSEDTQAVSEIYKQAVANPIRTDDDRNADAKRKPLDFLKFAEVRPGMRVLDVAAGGGYTTQLLALAVGKNGTVWAQGTQLQAALQKRLASHPHSNIVPVIRLFEDPVPDGVSELDLITVIMNYHDIAYMPVDRAKMVQRLFNALKPGATRSDGSLCQTRQRNLCVKVTASY